MNSRAFLGGYYQINSQHVRSMKMGTGPILGDCLEHIISWCMTQLIYTASNSETTSPKISRHCRHSSTGSKMLRGIKARLQGER